MFLDDEFMNEEETNNNEDFGDFDIVGFELKSLFESKSSVDNIIKENYDPRIKSVGDRVLVWDSSRLTYAETDTYVKDDIEKNILTKYHSIVIEENCIYDATKKTNMGDFSLNLDLKVWNKNLNKVYRTSSKLVKLI